MITITTKEYENRLELFYETKIPLFVQGGFGIGKSSIPRQVFKRVAEKEDVTYLEWSDLSPEKKKECIANPEDYFIFMDARVSQMDTTALQGIPNMNNVNMLENIPYSWVVYFTQPTAKGAIFFDELNLAPPVIQAITYSVINDRVVSDRKISDNVYVFAAGNRSEDKAHTFVMASPLKDRFAEFVLEHDAKEWCNWASDNGVNPHLISLINWKSELLYKVDCDSSDKPSTPRGICRASKLIENIDLHKDWKLAHEVVSMACGQGFATFFEAYVKAYRKLDWDKLFKNPETVNELKNDELFAVAGGLYEQFFKYAGKDTEKTKCVLTVLSSIDRVDMAVYSAKLIVNKDRVLFGDSLRATKVNISFFDRVQKYI